MAIEHNVKAAPKKKRANKNSAAMAQSPRKSQPKGTPDSKPKAERPTKKAKSDVSTTGGPVRVPGLRGMPLAEAMELLTFLGIAVEDCPTRESWPSYLVKSSRPRAGTILDGVRRDKCVELNLIGEVRVPRLKGLSLAAATAKLSEVGLMCAADLEPPFGFYYQWRGEVPDSSIVVGVDPPSRSVLRQGSKVKLRVDHPLAVMLQRARGRSLDVVLNELSTYDVNVWVEDMWDGGRVFRRKRWTVTDYEVREHWNGRPEIRLTAERQGWW